MQKRNVCVTSAIVFFIVLASARITAPYFVKNYINHLLDEQQDLSGQVQDVDLALYRGGYRIQGIEISQRINDDFKPLLKADELAIRLSWKALFKGEIVADMIFRSPQIIVSDDTSKKEQVSETVTNEQTWLGLAKNLVPISIDNLRVTNGSITFEAISVSKTAEFSYMNINGLVQNLNNNESSKLLTSVKFEGSINQAAPLVIEGELNPNTTKPNFTFSVDMGELPASETADLVDIYAPFDIEAGRLDMAAKINAEQGELDGFIEVGIYDLSVFSFKDDIVDAWKDDNDGLFQPFVESLSGLITTLLESPKDHLIATRIPLSGNIESPNKPYFEAFAGLLHNAFVEAYKLKVDNLISTKPVTR